MMYKTILMDPPWAEYGGGKIKRGADRHYPLIRDVSAIVNLVVLWSGYWNPDPEGCHLYCWVTNNHLKQGLELVEQLGFSYVTNLVWVKDRIGLGQYFRGQHELCLFARMGQTMLPRDRTVPTVILEPRRQHSQKPEGLVAAIERVSPGPYLELFARAPRAGWDVWGNEVVTIRVRREHG